MHSTAEIKIYNATNRTVCIIILFVILLFWKQ